LAKPTKGFCHDIKRTLKRLGNTTLFAQHTTVTSREWREAVTGAVAAYEQGQWHERLMKRSDSEWYCSVKQRWGMEAYLSVGGHSAAQWRGRKARAQMRLGVAPLHANIHKTNPLHTPICPHCNLAPEDETHAICDCPTHDDARRALYAVVQQKWQQGENSGEQWWQEASATGAWAEMTSRQRAVWLLAEEDVAVATAMHVFLTALLAAKHRAGFGFAYAQKMAYNKR
jgi:hypothetical protein